MKQKDFSHKDIGDIGEEIAARYLERRGFKIVERNMWRKWGEIDIIAEHKGRVHFVEVKTIKDVYEGRNVSYETFRPEEQVHPRKLQKLFRTISLWLDEVSCEKEWQLDIIAIRINVSKRSGKIRYMPNIIGE